MLDYQYYIVPFVFLFSSRIWQRSARSNYKSPSSVSSISLPAISIPSWGSVSHRCLSVCTIPTQPSLCSISSTIWRCSTIPVPVTRWVLLAYLLTYLFNFTETVQWRKHCVVAYISVTISVVSGMVILIHCCLLTIDIHLTLKHCKDFVTAELCK